jgi:hypothetical protein
MPTWIDEEGRLRERADDKHQFLRGIPLEFLDPWTSYDSWDTKLAIKLITIGYNLDIDGYWDEAKNLPYGSTGYDSARVYVDVYQRGTSIAKSSIAAGLLKDSDTPANWLAWAKRKGYDVAHLEHPQTAGVANSALVKTEGTLMQRPNAQKVVYHLRMHARLEPTSNWKVSRISDTDILNLKEASKMASQHANIEISENDFLRAAGRGEILLRAIVHSRAKVHSTDGGVFCNAGQPDENVIPAGSIPTLPLTACQHLAATGCAAWRTFDGFETVDSTSMRYTKGALLDGEPDFETVPDDCRVTGYDTHALADAFIDVPTTDTAKHAPVQAVGAFVVDKPWLIKNQKDPEPTQPWYTPARYFARQLVSDDSTLLTKRALLSQKVSVSLSKSGFFKRGGVQALSPDTVKKAFVNVVLG